MKKLLLISYYFPPCGGAPVQRWLRFIPRLVEQEWNITVICPKEGNYPAQDETLMAKIPTHVRVVRCGGSLLKIFGTKLKLPYGDLRTKQDDSFLKKALIWIRLNLIIPDIRVTWNKHAYRAAMRELSLSPYDAVITTGPPHSTHLVGLRLKQRLSIRWITDFRDPWSDVYYLKLNPPSRMTLFAHKLLEKRVISHADMNIVVSENIAEQLPQGRKQVIYNGYDPRDIEGIEYLPGEKFRVHYIGMVTAGQDLGAIPLCFDKIKELKDIDLCFVGRNDPDKLAEAIGRIGNVSISIQPFVPHKEALSMMVNCELLLLLINDYQGSEGMLTTKLFEYMASGTPILCLGNTDGEAAEAITGSATGACYGYYDHAAGEYVESVYQAWQNKTPIRTTGEIAKYSVDNQIKRLIELLD